MTHMPEFLHMPQCTPAWFSARLDVVTASCFNRVMHWFGAPTSRSWPSNTINGRSIPMRPTKAMK